MTCIVWNCDTSGILIVINRLPIYCIVLYDVGVKVFNEIALYSNSTFFKSVSNDVVVAGIVEVDSIPVVRVTGVIFDVVFGRIPEPDSTRAVRVAGVVDY